MPLSRKLDGSLFAVGVVLCLIYAGAMIDRTVGSRLALRSFAVAKASGDGAVSPTGGPGWLDLAVDHRFWSPTRIAAYRDALASRFAPPIAVLRVPKVGIEVAVFEGTDELTLNRGVGRIAGTARPGQDGNIGIAGHRDGFFRGLKDIARGDSLTLETGRGTSTYVVDRISIVNPADVSVLAPTVNPSMTLVTCYPFYFVGKAPQRYIVRCSVKERLPALPADDATSRDQP